MGGGGGTDHGAFYDAALQRRRALMGASGARSCKELEGIPRRRVCVHLGHSVRLQPGNILQRSSISLF